MPSSWRNKCDNFVDVYGPQIIHFLMQEATPDVICQMVGACHSENQIFEITKAKDPKQLYEFDEVITTKTKKMLKIIYFIQMKILSLYLGNTFKRS